MQELTLGSLFDGIGGFCYAAYLTGRIKPIWAAEIEQNCIDITRYRFPEVMHVGSVTELKGDEIQPVDIITFGSPCQDLSIAGQRKGLKGNRSGLFMEAIRIIEEMRLATNGKYPTFIIWENVPGAFSSANGADFRAVLEKITKTSIPMPTSGEWATAGMVRGAAVDTAWRVLDAQFWGVPQRRKRIYLIGDFGGQRAGEILFKSESVLGYTPKSKEQKQEIAGQFADSVRTENSRAGGGDNRAGLCTR
nr:DNA (cytosine-5-)-methyltransferase [uncultured Lachnoclostridium sp.]